MLSKPTERALLTIGIGVLLAGGASAGELDRELRPRSELPKAAKLVAPAYPHTLVVKFRDGVKARAGEAGELVSGNGSDLSAPAALAARRGATFRPVITLAPGEIEFIEARAAEISGVAQPDLAAMMEVRARPGELEALGNELLASPLTEWVEFEELTPPPPGCVDLSPGTPDYFGAGKQHFHGSDPGLNLIAARSMGHMRGAGVKVADCEYGYIIDHEDLCRVIPEPDQTMDDTIEHGTAVLGVLGAEENGFGVTGLVPDATPYFFCEYSMEEGGRRTESIAAAVAAMDVGDVIVLEMQTIGAGGGYVPAEHTMGVWTVTKLATDSNIIVVAAAGNGNQDLDSEDYAPYRERGDSGAIIVGGGEANPMHNKLWFSTYGARVNVQGWGEAVFTSGYGDYALLGGDTRQGYTALFSGTSAATPLVAGAVAALQGRAQAQFGRRLRPLEMRDLLTSTGLPQGTGGHIGPFPDCRAAAVAIDGMHCEPDCNWDGVTNVNDFVCFQSQFKKRTAYGDFDHDGQWNIKDFLAFLTSFRAGCP